MMGGLAVPSVPVLNKDTVEQLRNENELAHAITLNQPAEAYGNGNTREAIVRLTEFENE
jgi:hypothetical protein